MLMRAAIWLLLGCSALLLRAEEEKKEKPDPKVFFKEKIQPILKKHCYDCHDDETQKGDLNLAQFDELGKIHAAAELFRTVEERVVAFEMPPEGKKELNFDSQRRLVEWFKGLPKPEHADCDQIASDRNANFYRGYVMSRRINRAEYKNTIRDLFGIKIDTDGLLPADGGGGEGFDTSGNALFVSSIHIEKYMAAAELVLRTVLPDELAGASAEVREARKKILGGVENPAKEKARTAARDAVERISRLAYRRPAAEEEVERSMKLFDRAWERGDSYAASVRLALKSVLISPNFLFLAELEPAEKGVQPLGALALASKLSYFIWSSMPDQELLEAAESGKLLEGNEYLAQLRRMLADPKAAALGERFAVQWLDLERLGTEVKPDPSKFPEFNAELQDAMLGEVKAHFNYVVAQDRPLLELIDADYTFVNERLAKIYEIPNVSGPQMQKVSLGTPNRGGVTGMAAVHALTSFPLRTSPVLRGRWVLEAMLGEKVKPPPPDVPALEEHSEQAKNLSLRDQLKAHREKPDCASCHDKMDPLGFGMENFDALGRWREMDRGLPIDAQGTLPGGESFTGPSGLKIILMARKDDVVKHLVRKMTGYAYGRELNKFDDCVVSKAVEALKSSQYKPSVLIEQIATSFPFRHRFYPRIVAEGVNEKPEIPAPAAGASE